MVDPKSTPRGEAAHDVLAAEEFGVPASDPVLHHGPLALPEDPTGIAEAHDVLAAEEFALPAPGHVVGSGGSRAVTSTSDTSRTRPILVAVGALAVLLVRRARRRQRR